MCLDMRAGVERGRALASEIVRGESRATELPCFTTQCMCTFKPLCSVFEMNK